MSEEHPNRTQNRDLLKTSRYDEVSSMLISLLILFGILVGTLLFFWLTFTLFPPTVAVPPILNNISDSDSMDDGIQLDQPMADQLGIDTDVEEPAYEHTMAAMMDAVAINVAVLDSPLSTGDTQMGRGGSTGTGKGVAGGRGWGVSFDRGNTVESYARQLDYFGIEMGIPDKGEQLIYVKDFSKTSSVRRGKSSDEKRRYLTWQNEGGLRQADMELFSRAGVNASNKVVFKFLPDATAAKMAEVELNHAGSRASRIRNTVFGIRVRGNGYEFFVLRQEYKN